jgi:hypothetical protein
MAAPLKAASIPELLPWRYFTEMAVRLGKG